MTKSISSKADGKQAATKKIVDDYDVIAVVVPSLKDLGVGKGKATDVEGAEGVMEGNVKEKVRRDCDADDQWRPGRGRKRRRGDDGDDEDEVTQVVLVDMDKPGRCGPKRRNSTSKTHSISTYASTLISRSPSRGHNATSTDSEKIIRVYPHHQFAYRHSNASIYRIATLVMCRKQAYNQQPGRPHHTRVHLFPPKSRLCRRYTHSSSVLCLCTSHTTAAMLLSPQISMR